MKRLFSILAAASLITACNPDNIDFSAGGNSAGRLTDSTLVANVVSDSLASLGVAVAPISYSMLGTAPELGVSVTVPVIPDNWVEPTGMLAQFQELAKLTGGETNYVQYAKGITQQFIDILDTNLVDNSDLVFMIDGTASMFDDIDNVKRGVTTIIKHVRMHSNVRVGVSVYRDIEDGASWFQYYPLTTEYDSVIAFVNTLSAFGGGMDWPESVYDGAALTMDTMEWRKNSPKMLLVLGDAPALTGARTNHTLEDVVLASKEHGVDMNFYPVIITTQLAAELVTSSTVSSAPVPAPPMIDQVFPNPSAGDVTISMNKEDDYLWQVTDVAGGKIQEGNSYTNSIHLDLSGLPNGVYLIKVTGNGKTESKPIVVAH